MSTVQLRTTGGDHLDLVLFNLLILAAFVRQTIELLGGHLEVEELFVETLRPARAAEHDATNRVTQASDVPNKSEPE